MKKKYYLNKLLRKVLRKYCNICNMKFIQVGANDGIKGQDPLHVMIKRYKWQGILIEPLPDIFIKLKENYSGCTGLIYENVAIHLTDKEVTLFRYSGGSLPSSLLRKKSALGKRKNSEIILFKVPSLTLNNIIEKHNWFDIDLLQIDTEGYDLEVMKSIDLNIHKPRVIHYEDIFLKTAQCRRYLKQFGYKKFIRTSDRDIIAIRK